MSQDENYLGNSAFLADVLVTTFECRSSLYPEIRFVTYVNKRLAVSTSSGYTFSEILDLEGVKTEDELRDRVDGVIERIETEIKRRRSVHVARKTVCT